MKKDWEYVILSLLAGVGISTILYAIVILLAKVIQVI